MRRERAQGADGRKDDKNPFRGYAQKELHIWIKRDECGEHREMHRARSCQSRLRRQSPDRQDQRRRQEQKRVQPNVCALTNKAFDLASEEKKHVHLDREPEQRIAIWRMNECVGEESPNLPAQDLSAVEHQVIQRATVPETDK